MRRIPAVAALGLLALTAADIASAQQGSLTVSGSAQALTGPSERIAGQERLEPDLAVSWLQPGARFGTFQIEIRGIARDGAPHLGRSFASWRDVKLARATWSFEAGDFYFSPANTGYRFTNLVANPVTLLGGSLTARTKRSTATFVAGRTTAWRNIFGTDSEALGQSLALARFSHQPFSWLSVSARGSRVRTRDLEEFAFSVSSSDQAGVGLHFTPSTTFHIVADGGYNSYTRAGSTQAVRDASGMVGVTYLHSRGWLQANVSRFSPGELPVLNYSLTDRQGAFIAAEHDVLERLRLFAGWESIDTNLDPVRAALTPLQMPQSSGERAFGGMRLILFPRMSLSLRAEEGGRRTRRVTGFFADSDSGMVSGELYGQFGRVTSFLRYARRDNVESAGPGSYKQSDGAFQTFLNVSREIQVFGTAAATRSVTAGGEGLTSWQFGGGGQFQLFDASLTVRLEGLTTRNEYRVTDHLAVRDSLNVGVNGNIARNTTLGLNLFADRSPLFVSGPNEWATRSTLRVVRSFPTGSVRVAGHLTGSAAEIRARGTATVAGTVFADWDADGVPDQGEDPLEGIPVLLARGGATTTSARGEFAFTNVPAGAQYVQVDIAALPVDFDPPSVPGVEIALSRNETHRVAFGLVPLGSVSGRVLRDANGNGSIDAGDEPFDGAVLVLDGGLRSEQARRGQFRFEAVRAGAHALELLTESLPEGATVLSAQPVSVAIRPGQLAPSADFLVKLDQRPEIRRVFPPKRGTGTAAVSSTNAPRGRTPGAASPPRTGRRTVNAGGLYTIQVAALSQLTRALALADELQAAGHQAYVLKPADDDPNGLYRVRIGQFASRTAAAKVMPALEELRGEKLWIIRAR